MSTNNNLDNYQPIDRIIKTHPQLTVNQLRWIVANKERYKIAHAIKRIGRRLYFHIPSLSKWIEQQNA